MWEDPVEIENFESSDFQGFAPPEEVVSSAPPLEIMSSPLEEINPSVPDNPAVTFADNTDVSQGPPIVTSRPG